MRVSSLGVEEELCRSKCVSRGREVNSGAFFNFYGHLDNFSITSTIDICIHFYSSKRKIIFDDIDSSSKYTTITIKERVKWYKISYIRITSIFHEFYLFSQKIGCDDLMARIERILYRRTQECKYSRHSDRKNSHPNDQFENRKSFLCTDVRMRKKHKY